MKFEIEIGKVALIFTSFCRKISSVTKNTFAVLVKDKDEDTGKANQARKLNIQLMTPEEFANEYFGE